MKSDFKRSMVLGLGFFLYVTSAHAGLEKVDKAKEEAFDKTNERFLFLSSMAAEYHLPKDLTTYITGLLYSSYFRTTDKNVTFITVPPFSAEDPRYVLGKAMALNNVAWPAAGKAAQNYYKAKKSCPAGSRLPTDEESTELVTSFEKIPDFLDLKTGFWTVTGHTVTCTNDEQTTPRCKIEDPVQSYRGLDPYYTFVLSSMCVWDL